MIHHTSREGFADFSDLVWMRANEWVRLSLSQSLEQCFLRKQDKSSITRSPSLNNMNLTRPQASLPCCTTKSLNRQTYRNNMALNSLHAWHIRYRSLLLIGRCTYANHRAWRLLIPSSRQSKKTSRTIASSHRRWCDDGGVWHVKPSWTSDIELDERNTGPQGTSL